MANGFSLITSIWIFLSLAHGYDNCPGTQTADTHLVCLIFMNTTIESVFPGNDFSDLNYCDWGYNRTLIGCNSPSDTIINWIEIEEAGLIGTLDVTVPWPQNLIELDLEQIGIYLLCNVLFFVMNINNLSTYSTFR